MFTEQDEPISLPEKLIAIYQMGNPDRLIKDFFVHGKHVLFPYLHTLVNRIFTLSYFQDARSIGEVIPLHKKGDKSNVNNY